jgi:hypothetical protein
MRAASRLLGGAILGVLGCSSVPVPAPANLSGSWDFSYVTVSAAGATCHGSMTFTISQTDQTFVGVQRGSGTLLCEGVTPLLPNPNASDPTQFDGEMISAGVVSPTEVAFTLDILRSRDAGTVVQDGMMTGTSTWQLAVQPRGTVTVTGTWTAIKNTQ